jgi:light-regulated signal transduction histidine kinase (bacteriophytochrome)
MISSFMQLLQNSQEIEKTEKSEQYISFAIDGALRMKRLIRDLLTYSRVGTTEEDFQEVDVKEIIDDTIMVYQEIIKSKNAEIIVSNCPRIKAIHSLLGQLFDNLISNALKYNRSNKPIIEIDYSETNNHYVFHVKDNGIGIDPKHFDMIYLPFKRLHNKNEYSGTGIGLAVCKKIVEKHEGKLWVESIPGEGSKFSFSIVKELPNN